MGLFNEFENNNLGVSPTTKNNLIRQAPYLTNQERNNLRSNTRLNLGNINARITKMVGNKIKRANLSRMKISPLQMSIFNGFVNGDSKKGNYNVNVKELIYKKPVKRQSVSPNSNFEIQVESIKLLYGRMQIGAKHTFTVTPNANTVNKHRYFAAQIDGYSFENGEKRKFLFKIYANGKMQVAGGMINNNSRHPEMIRKFVIDKYASKYNFLYNPIQYVTLVGTFQTNGAINLDGVARAFVRSGNVDYEPELRPALKMTYYGNKFQLFTSGKIQIMGSKTVKALHDAYNPIGYDLVKSLRVMGLFKPGFINTPNKPQIKTGVNTKVDKKKTTTKSNNVTYLNKNKNGTNGVRIGGRKCGTIDRPRLISVAEKLGIVDITRKTTKPQICTKIKDKTFGTFKVNNIPCRAYTKEKLATLAVARGVAISDTDTVDTLCEKLKIPKRKTITKKESRSLEIAKKRKTVLNEKVKQRINKRRLSDTAIKQDIEKEYGKRWMKKYKNLMPSLNTDVTEIKKRINALSSKNKNKAGVPFKSAVNKIKKNSVQTWKFIREKNLNNKLNKLNNNFAKELNNIFNKKNSPNSKKNSPKKYKYPPGTKVEEI
jgi:TATA-box binding protein (TBP) (component of TFIID and TFIIIB)